MTTSPETASAAAVPQTIHISPVAAAVHADDARQFWEQRAKMLLHMLIAEQTKNARLEERLAELSRAAPEAEG